MTAYIMKKYETICEGDILMPIGQKFMARSIQFFMNIFKKREGIKKKLNPNHADRVCIFEGQICLDGMVPNPAQKGIRAMLRTGLYTRPLFDEDYIKKGNYIVLTPRIPYSKLELDLLEDFKRELQARSVRYGFGDILRQIGYSFTGIWKGKKGKASEDRVICTEFIAMGENRIRPNSFPEPWHVNPAELYNSKLYRMKNIDYEYYKNLYLNYKEEKK